MSEEISVAKMWRWGVLGVLGVIGTVAFVIWLATASSGVRGKAGVTRQNNDSQNQISAQHEFDRVYNDVQRDVFNVQHAVDAAHLADDQAICVQDVGTYNTDTVDTTLKDWRPDSLPAHIDPDKECAAK